ncbi:MAG: glycosyltransferase family 2 protein [Acidobacteriota bacterium]
MSIIPEVTVLMCVRNGELFFEEALASILNQSFGDFELLVVDDASEDSTPDMLDAVRDPRLRVVRNAQCLGVTRSLNVGLGLARGGLVARMDADDVSHPERLAMQVARMRARPEVAVLATTIEAMDRHGKPLPPWREDLACLDHAAIKAMLPRENCVAHPSVMYRRDVVAQRGYDPGLLVAQDYGLWLRLCSEGFIFDKLPEPLLRYRVHGSSATQKRKLSDERGIKASIRLKSRHLARRAKTLRLNAFDARVAAHLARELWAESRRK